MKLNVLLGRTDALGASFKANILDFIKFFKASQSSFKGEKRTYEPKADTIDEPGERKNVKVVTTVAEKLKWLEDNQSEYLGLLFNQEATNASGTARANLLVGDLVIEMSSLELLRLKNILESQDFKNMYAEIPVRSDAEIWDRATVDEYSQRDVYQTPLTTGVKKTTTKRPVILEDPNVDKLKTGTEYKPVVGSIDTVMELGDYTYQRFSGEFSHRQRAEILQRIGKLHAAVCTALKECNEAEVIHSNMTGTALFDYLHRGE